MTLVEAREFYAFLQGGPVPKGFTIRARPRLTRNAAFSVIYVLQERYRLIPDNFEACATCDEIFDTHEGGGRNQKSGKFYCDTCLPEPQPAEPK